MKYFFFIILSIVIFSCTNPNNNGAEIVIENNMIKGTTAEKEDNRTKEEIINDIKKQYQIIIEGKGSQQFKIDTISYICPNGPGEGEIIFYSDKLGVWMIEHTEVLGDHGGGMEQYYVWDGELFFIFSDESYWTFDAGTSDDGMQQNTVDYFTERRYYFNKGEVLKCLEKKYEVRTAKKNNPKTENVQNVEIEAEDTKERLAKFKQLMNVFGKESMGDNCPWDY